MTRFIEQDGVSDPVRSDRSIYFALCVTRSMLPGAHVTLYSALSRIPRSDLAQVYVYYEGLADAEIEELVNTAKHASESVRVHCRRVDLDVFRGMRNALGSPINYALFNMPHEIDSDYVIYLDVDIIVRCDLSVLYRTNIGDATMAAVSWGRISGCGEWQLFKELGRNGESPYFNGGVLLIDNQRWRNMDVGCRASEFVRKYGRRLVGCVQPALNHVLYGDICSLPRRFVSVYRPKIVTGTVAQRTSTRNAKMSMV